MSVNRRTRHGVVFGRGTVGSAVAVLPEPMVSGVTGVGCAAAALASRKTAIEKRELMPDPSQKEAAIERAVTCPSSDGSPTWSCWKGKEGAGWLQTLLGSPGPSAARRRPSTFVGYGRPLPPV